MPSTSPMQPSHSRRQTTTYDRCLSTQDATNQHSLPSDNCMYLHYRPQCSSVVASDKVQRAYASHNMHHPITVSLFCSKDEPLRLIIKRCISSHFSTTQILSILRNYIHSFQGNSLLYMTCPLYITLYIYIYNF